MPLDERPDPCPFPAIEAQWRRTWEEGTPFNITEDPSGAKYCSPDDRERSRVTADVSAREAERQELALAVGRVRPWLDGRPVARVVVARGRLVNTMTPG